MRSYFASEKRFNILLTIAVLFLAVSAAFLVEGEHGAIDYILSGLSIAGITFSVYVMTNRNLALPSHSLLLPLLTLFFAFIYPESLYQYRVNLISLVLIWTVYTGVKSGVEEKGYGALFISYLLLSAIILIVPQLVWLMPFFLVMSIYYRGFDMRSLFAMLAGAATPILYFVGYKLISEGSFDAGGAFADFVKPITAQNIYNPFDTFSLNSVLLIIVLLTLLYSFWYIISNNRKQKVKVAKALNMISLVIIALFILTFFSTGDNIPLSYALIYPYISIVLFYSFKNSISWKSTKIVMCALIIVVVLVRVADIMDVESIADFFGSLFAL